MPVFYSELPNRRNIFGTVSIGPRVTAMGEVGFEDRADEVLLAHDLRALTIEGGASYVTDTGKLNW